MSDPFIGQIMTVGFNFPPRGWASCEGELLSISSNQALFSLLGATFGGDARTTFGLPDLRGRSIVGQGQGAGLSNINLGQKSGAEKVTLTETQMPSHTHTLLGENVAATSSNPNGNMMGRPADPIYVGDHPTSDKAFFSNAIAAKGGGQAFDIRNPYLGLQINIALTGVYPSRN
jgi:microcystin-dependent protein